MKKVWVLEKLENEKWTSKWVTANYFSFVGGAKKILREYDTEEAEKFKLSLGNVPYSDEIRMQFRSLHSLNRSKFRVVEAETNDSNSVDIKFIKVNPDIYSFLWNTKYTTKKEHR